MGDDEGVGARELMERWFEELWIGGDQRVLDELRVPAARSSGLSRKPLGNAELRTFQARVRELFTDIEWSIERVIETETDAAVAVKLRVRTRRGRKKLELRGIALLRLEGGRIAEAENLWDVAGLVRQLGDRWRPTPSTLEELVDAMLGD